MKTKKRKASDILDLKESKEHFKDLELQKKNLNVSAGRKIYERARSRRERDRAALMAHSHISRTEAIPLSRGGARGPGLAELPKADVARDEELGDEKLLASTVIGSPPPKAKQRLGKSQRLLSSGGGTTRKKNSKSPASSENARKLSTPIRKGAASSKPKKLTPGKKLMQERKTTTLTPQSSRRRR